MHPPGADTVLVRHGEIGTKSPRVLGRMEERLVENIGAMLDARGIPGEAERRRMRPVVHTDAEHVEAATNAAADTFGVVSASAARVVAPDQDAIETALAETAREHYAGGTFAVEARRSTDELPFTSHDLQESGGSAVWEAVSDRLEPEVDLEDPDVTFGVEARADAAYVFLERREGPGGLPLGSQPPLVALVSGGIDSPVAAHEVMRRGAPVVPVYLALGDYGGPDHEARAVEAVRSLADYAPGFDLRPYRVPAGEYVARLADAMDRGRMLSFRRFMFRVADHLADREDCHGVVTGEAVGQKSSQTTRNLAVTSAATDLPVHRPLLAWDKTDIEGRARELGTFEAATIPAGCNRLVPDRPETNGHLPKLREVEPDDLFAWAEAAAADAERVEW